MSQLGTEQPTASDYKDGRTKQSFKDETDINIIMKRAQKSGTISHLNKYQPLYGDFSEFDFFAAQLKLAEGREIFDALPPELRNEFNQEPAAFFDYVNDPANKDRLDKLLPALAEPGRQNIAVGGDPPADDAKVLAEAQKPAKAAEVPEAPKEPEKPPEAAAKAPEVPSSPVT